MYMKAFGIGIATAILIIIFFFWMGGHHESAASAASRVIKVDKIDLTADKAEFVGNIVGWKGFQQAFQLYEVKIIDGRTVFAISSDPHYRYESYRVGVKSIGWRDSAGNEVFVITGPK